MGKQGMPIKDNAANMVREVASSFDARFLGLAALVPVLEVFRRISFSLPIALSQASTPDGCIAALVAGLLATFATVLALTLHGRQMPRGALPAVGLICSSAGMVLMLPWAFGISSILGAEVTVPCSYLLIGCGCGALLLAWVHVLTQNNALVNLLYVSSSVLLGNCLLFVIIELDDPNSLWALLTCCIAASSLLLCWITVGQSGEGDGAADASEPASISLDDTSSDEKSLAFVIRSSLTAPATGLALGVFSWGVMAIPPMPYLHDHKAWVYLVGNLVAFGVILALMYTLRGGARYAVMRQKMFFLLPVFAVFMSYFSFIRMLDAEGGLKNFLSVGYNMSIAGFFTLFMVAAAAQSKEKGLPVTNVAAPALIACTLSYGLGALLYEVYGNTAMYFQIVFTTLYILGLAFISSRKASLNDASRLEERCAAAGRKFGLSQREEEVLRLTVGGYTATRIAEELTISPETVRTHKKRIYAKLDVHSHDELMRLVRTGKK